MPSAFMTESPNLSLALPFDSTSFTTSGNTSRPLTSPQSHDSKSRATRFARISTTVSAIFSS